MTWAAATQASIKKAAEETRDGILILQGRDGTTYAGKLRALSRWSLDLNGFGDSVVQVYYANGGMQFTMLPPPNWKLGVKDQELPI